ncbi:MAG: hypothetical protein R3C68_08290 [Myxococcota bacterium]
MTDEASEARRKLEQLFSRGNHSEESPPAHRSPMRAARPAPSGKVFSSPRKTPHRGFSEYRVRLERLRLAREPEEIQQATDAFLEHHQLPDDLDILYKVIQHPSEKIVREALGQFSSLMMQGRLTGTLLLKDRLKDLAARAQEDATRSYIEGIQGYLAKMAPE